MGTEKGIAEAHTVETDQAADRFPVRFIPAAVHALGTWEESARSFVRRE